MVLKCFGRFKHYSFILVLISYLILFYSCEPSTDNTVTTPPSTPTSLVASISTAGVDLSWHDGSTNETGFKIERKVNTSGSWSEIGTTSLNTNSYQDTHGISPDTEYVYRVRAYNSSGNSAYSNEAFAHTPDAIATINQAGGTLEVINSSSPINGFRLTIPAGTVDGASTFTVMHQDSIPGIPLPTGVTQDGPVISLLCSSQLKGPIVADVPFTDAADDTEVLLFFHFNESLSTWELVDPLPTLDTSKRKMILHSFSQYVKGRAQISYSAINSGFRFDTEIGRAHV